MAHERERQVMVTPVDSVSLMGLCDLGGLDRDSCGGGGQPRSVARNVPQDQTGLEIGMGYG